jgi:hypothetical protein
VTANSQRDWKEKRLPKRSRTPLQKTEIAAARQPKSFFTRNGATAFLTPDGPKIAWFSVLLSNPFTKDVFTSRSLDL